MSIAYQANLLQNSFEENQKRFADLNRERCFMKHVLSLAK